MSEKISFTTSDGVTIVGNLYKGGSERFAIFLHMRPSTKEGWDAVDHSVINGQAVTCLALTNAGMASRPWAGTRL